MVHEDDAQSTGSSDQSLGSSAPLTAPQQLRKNLLEQKPDEQFWSYNIGSFLFISILFPDLIILNLQQISKQKDGAPTVEQMFLSVLCPCLVGNPCSPVRRNDYIV